MNLVIVESPSKAKTIKKYLGKEYEVKASKGHVVDLPKSGLSVDVENNFKPDYQVTKQKVLTELRKAYKEADKLILAVDLDREGEAIAWHIAQKLGAIKADGSIKKGHSVERIVFSEITKDAIKEAIAHPRDLDMNLINAQQARRVLDRLVGYKLSPLLWKKIMFGLSAGRVQSVALRLVVERELERRAFKPEEYWSIVLGASEKEGKQEVLINLSENKEEEVQRKVSEDLISFDLFKKDGKKISLSNENDSRAVIDDIKNKKLRVKEVTSKTVKRNPKAPFITSTLQRSAINRLGFTAKRTMIIAQKLYEKGFITYMRTDSTNLSDQAVKSTRSHIKRSFGQKYLPDKAKLYSKKAKNAQEAHEAIRPVNIATETDKDMDVDMQKLYDLIRNRTLACQMVPAEIEQNSIIATINNYEFKVTGSRVLFDGFLKASKDKVSENMLPNLKSGDELFAHEILGNQHFTQPPARYSEASLVKQLETLGIGRPSTYASIISTILSRKYAEKEGKYLRSTTKGEVVNKLLVKYFENVVDYGFTAEMEDKLDDIAQGKVDWIKMLDEFYHPFEEQVVKKDKEIPREEFTVLGKAPKNIHCPVCGSHMQIKLGRYGEFYSCERWPDCKGMRSIDGKSEEDIAKEAETEEFKKSYEGAPKTEDGRNYLYKRGKYGGFWAHPDYPKVKDAQPLVYKREKLVELYGEPPKTKDGKEFLLRNGRYGEFWAHPDYPKVKEIRKIKKS